MEYPIPTAQHQWLHQLVGTWTMEGGEGEHHSTGREVVSRLGDLWIVGQAETSMGDVAGNLQWAIGYDTEKGRFVGHWIGSMMVSQFIYEGDLNPTGKILTLNTEGPSWEEGCQTGYAKYRDIHEIISDSERLLRSEMQMADGSWTEFMRVTYTRVS